ncbi:MAG: DUF711 family protein [Anaerolineales bacterium]
MRIRSITYFCNPGWPLRSAALQEAAQFLRESRRLFEEAGYEVQSTRLATVPFPSLLGGELKEVTRLAQTIEQVLEDLGVDYAALGPALPQVPQSFGWVVEALSATRRVFLSAILTDHRSRLSLLALQETARLIVELSTVEENGFANLRFAALVNIPPGTPFFPAAYHQGSESAFALAMETADLAIQAFEGVASLEEGRDRLIAHLEQEAQNLARLADFLKYRHMIRFGGFDFSLAPFPAVERSIGAALERMGLARLGAPGSLASVALLTQALEEAHFPHAGFCGVMLPVLEDAVLAERVRNGQLELKDLLLYSAVCGTGLDTVPLPGDATPEQISALLLDLATLSLRLKKPLTARLMPIPGKKAGEMTTFEFPFFANTRILPLSAGALTLRDAWLEFRSLGSLSQ